jgi:predicted RNA-binding protein associated with RNAse of E/G family
MSNQNESNISAIGKRTPKQEVLITIKDLCSDFLFYDRKEDETLSVSQLNQAVENGDVTIDEMVDEFRKNLEETFNN